MLRRASSGVMASHHDAAHIAYHRSGQFADGHRSLGNFGRQMSPFKGLEGCPIS